MAPLLALRVAGHTYRLWYRCTLSGLLAVEGVHAAVSLGGSLYIVRLDPRYRAREVLEEIERVSGGEDEGVGAGCG
jgi:hypothetical protein